MNEYNLEAMELRVLAKAALIVDDDCEEFRRLSDEYTTICGHPPFCGFDDYSYDGAEEEAEIERGWVLAARKCRAEEAKHVASTSEKRRNPK